MKKIISILLILCAISAAVYFFTYFKKSQTTSDTNNLQTQDSSSNILSAKLDEEKKFINVTFKDLKEVKVATLYPDSTETVEVVDINYDNVDDLMVTESSGAYNMATYFMVQDQATRKFSEYDIAKRIGDGDDSFTGLGFVDFDKDGRILISSYKGRGLGDMYSEEVYEFKNGKWVLTKTVIQNQLDMPNTQTDGESGYYVRETETFSGGNSSIIKEYFKVRNSDDLGDLIQVTEKEVRQKGLIK